MHRVEHQTSELESFREFLALSEVVQTLEIGVIVFDRQGVVLELNTVASNLLSLTTDEARLLTALERIVGFVDEHGSRFDVNQLPSMTAMREGRPISKVVLGVDRPSLPRRWLSASATPIHREGAVEGAIAVFVDITSEIDRRHMLQITARVNQLIAGARDEAALMQGLCDLLVEAGGYALAWVGVGSDSVEDRLEPRWAAGETRFLFEGIVSASAESPRGRGPTGTAFRERVVRVVDNLEREPSYAPSRDRVREFGLSSAIAIPLDIGVPAVLTIYDRHRSAFDDAAVQSFVEVAHSVELQRALLRSLAETEAALEGTIEALATMTEFRDPYTPGHQLRVAELGKAIAQRLALEPSLVHRIYLGGTVHDIGKVVVPAEILTRPRGLSPSEFELVKEHCSVGAAVLSAASLPPVIVGIALEHHERLDGSGYPRGLSGDQITLPARIIAVADVIEAMTNHRPYRPALGLAAAVEEVKAGRGSRFDAEVVDACVAVFEGGFRMDGADATGQVS